jgi:dipeptidyl aminopeptidase/acylaminoacyl peptidase
LLLVPLDSPVTAKPLLPAQRYDGHPRISPDGKLLAYIGDDVRRWEVYVRTLPKGTRIQVSHSGGIEPVWSPDGRSLFYRGGGYIQRASIAASPTLSVTRRDTLFRDVYEQGHNSPANYDVFPTGKELLMIRSATGKAQIGVLQNWPELLRQRAVVH